MSDKCSRTPAGIKRPHCFIGAGTEDSIYINKTRAYLVGVFHLLGFGQLFGALRRHFGATGRFGSEWKRSFARRGDGGGLGSIMEEDAFTPPPCPLFVFAPVGGKVETEIPRRLGFLRFASTLAGAGVVTPDARGRQERELRSRPLAVQQ